MKKGAVAKELVRCKPNLPQSGEPTEAVPTPLLNALEFTETPINLDEEDEKLAVLSKLVQWSEISANQYIATGETIKFLKPGMYVPKWYKGTPSFEFRPVNIDELFSFPDSLAEKVIREIEEFWTHEHAFKQNGFMHRRGYLLYGEQGTGKSSLIQLIINDIVRRMGIVLYCSTDPAVVDGCLHHLQQVEPARKKVCIFEDIDALIETWGEEHILAILDGENQVDNVLNIATSNYPDKLDKRLKNRPRRFDKLIRVSPPAQSIRRFYFAKKISNITPEELDKWVEASQGFSFASLAEMVISIHVLEENFDETVKRLKEISKNKELIREKRVIGFTPNCDQEDGVPTE